MWPWEHVVFGYLLYSLYTHAVRGESPSDGSTVVLAFAAVLPDLIDKPLAWEFGVFSTGYALGHSILFAVPVSAGVWLLLRDADRPLLGEAFAIGYASHLVGDVLPASVRRGTIAIDRVLWPVWVQPARAPDGLREGVAYFLEDYLSALLTLELTPYMLVQLALLLVVTALWISDGAPPFPTAVAAVRSRIRDDSSERT